MNRIGMAVAGFLTALLGGALGGFVAVKWGIVPPVAPVEVAANPGFEPTEFDEFERRVSRLELALMRRETEQRLVNYAARASGNAKRGDEDRERDAGGPGSFGTAVDDPVFETAVRDVLDRVQGERDAERDERRQRRQEEAAAEWSRSLAEPLSLTEGQQDRLRQLATKFYESVRELWQQGEDAGAALSWRERRDQVQVLRTSYEAKLFEVLDGRQQQVYDGLEPEQRLGMGGGRRGRGREPR